MPICEAMSRFVFSSLLAIYIGSRGAARQLSMRLVV